MLNVTVSSIIWSMSEYVLWQFGNWKYVHIILLILFGLAFFWGCFPGSSAGKESACNAGDLSLMPGLGRSPGEGKGYSLQYSGLANSIDYTVHGVAKSRTQLMTFTFFFFDKYCLGFLYSSVGKESSCNAEDPSSIPGWGRVPGEGIGYLVHSSILGLPLRLS